MRLVHLLDEVRPNQDKLVSQTAVADGNLMSASVVSDLNDAVDTPDEGNLLSSNSSGGSRLVSSEMWSEVEILQCLSAHQGEGTEGVDTNCAGSVGHLPRDQEMSNPVLRGDWTDTDFDCITSGLDGEQGRRCLAG